MSRSRFSRRAFLKSLGAGMALMPLLSPGRSRAQGAFPKRLLVIGWTNGVLAEHYWPSGGETNFALDTPVLMPLASHKQDLIVMGGIDYQNLIDNNAGAGHAALPFMLTGVPGGTIDGQISDGVNKSAGGPSVDQYIARELQKLDPVPFESLVLRSLRYVGNDNYLSFSGPPVGGQPNAPTPEDDPNALYAKLFTGPNGGEEDGVAARLRARRKSVLDYVGRNLERYGANFGARDREKIEAHLTAVREIERRLDTSVTGCFAPERPTRSSHEYTFEPTNPNVPEVHKLQIDMVVAAMACDATRVATILWSNSNNNAYSFFWLGDEYVNGPRADDTGGFGGEYIHHHEIAHNGHRQGEWMNRKIGVDRWFHSELAYVIEKMKSVQEGDGTLLDNTAVLFVNCMSDGASHSVRDVPWILAGSCGGYFRTGRYLRRVSGGSSNIPQNGILRALCDAMGVPAEPFASGSPWNVDVPKLRG